MVHGRTLIIGYGNPGRLDDGLGVALADAMVCAGVEGVVVQSDYQLSAEHAAEIAGYGCVVFADASVDGEEPFLLRRLLPREAHSFSTHSMRPEALLSLAETCLGWKGEAYLLGIRGYMYNEFGEQLSERARENLDAAVRVLTAALQGGDIGSHVTGEPIRDSVTYSTGGGECAMANM